MASTASSEITREENESNEPQESDNTQETGFTSWGQSNHYIQMAGVQPYDALGQVVAHMVRDWSSDGALIRNSLYTWCLKQFELYPLHPQRVEPIVVPGAGMGRLAWELATGLDHSVEAIESSLSMSAAAHSILAGESFLVHPYALDHFTNEVDSSLRYDQVTIPDIDPTARGKGNLSFTVGDFNYEYMQNNESRYSAVVSCFFIDTATTVYDYLTTIESILVGGGLWINVGPLQWHRNNQLPVAADELRMILENFCSKQTRKPVFEILYWQVDSEPVNYRTDGRLRSTHFDAYCPLRFVLQKRSGDTRVHR